MPYTPYANLTIGTAAGVKLKIGSPSLVLQLTSDNTAAIDAAIQGVLNDTQTNVLSKHLDDHFRTVMPDTITRWVNQRQSWFTAWHRRANLDTLPIYGMYGGADSNAPGGAWLLSGQTFRPADDIGAVEPPYTWFFIGPVVNGSGSTATLLSIGNNGDRAFDTLNRILYVNRGSSTSVDWEVQTYEDVKDYLINPSILASAHNYIAIARMFEIGYTRLLVNYTDPARRDYFMEREEYYKNKFIAELYGEADERGRRTGAGVLKLLQTDYSNSGTFNEYSREINPEEVWTV